MHGAQATQGLTICADREWWENPPRDFRDYRRCMEDGRQPKARQGPGLRFTIHYRILSSTFGITTSDIADWDLIEEDE